jgi:PAS domain S-box-containing protein
LAEGNRGGTQALKVKHLINTQVSPKSVLFTRLNNKWLKVPMIRSLIQTDTLVARILFIIVLIVIITAVIAGAPGIILIRQQLDKQAWSRVEQGMINTQTLYQAHQNELVAFSTLISLRTCLQGVVRAQDFEDALVHLNDLRAGTEIELVILCDPNKQLTTTTMDLPVEHICADIKDRGFFIIEEDNQPHAWITGSRIMFDQNGHLGWVVSGLRAEDHLSTSYHTDTGIEFSILYQGRPIFATLDQADVSFAKVSLASGAQETDPELHRTIDVNGETYYAMRQVLEPPDLEYEIALSVTDILTSQRQLIWLLFGSIGFVIMIGSLAGVFLSRNISRPLEQLSETAVKFSSGNLTAPVTIATELREVVLVAKALEDARTDLLKTLTNLTKERAWVNHLIESIVEGIMTIDEDFRITFFSHGAERITGWQRSQVLHRPCDEIFRLPDSAEKFCKSIHPFVKESKVLVELADGRWATLAITGAILSNPEEGKDEIVLVFRDVTDEVIIHRRLGNLMANIAHEFRTPLSALAASIELLMDRAPHTEPEEMEALLESLHLGIFRLQTLVDNLIESASIEAGHFRVTPHLDDLGKIVHDSVMVMEPLFEKYGQRLRVELPDENINVWVDSRRTIQILVNLLSNANKYGPADSEICIRAVIENGYVKVTVLDSGPGIPAEKRDHLFRRSINQSSSLMPSKAGAGLGLSVVKAIVEAQGGQTGVEEGINGGSGFWFTMKTAGEM